MGYSQSSVAVRGKSSVAVLEALGAQRTGNREEVAESPLVCAELPGGWYLVVSQRDRLGLMEDSVLRCLSEDGEAVACVVSETVGYSGAACWRNGQRLWSVVHSSQPGKKHWSEHLEAEGQLPEIFSGIRDPWTSEQQKRGGRKARVDLIFEIPVELAHALTGYRHDRDIDGVGEHPFQVLSATQQRAVASTEKKATSWFGRLFSTRL